MWNLERFHNNTCIYCLAVNSDVKFQVDNFIRFVQDGLNLKMAIYSDKYKYNRVTLPKKSKTKIDKKAALPKQKNQSFRQHLHVRNTYLTGLTNCTYFHCV